MLTSFRRHVVAATLPLLALALTAGIVTVSSELAPAAAATAVASPARAAAAWSSGVTGAPAAALTAAPAEGPGSAPAPAGPVVDGHPVDEDDPAFDCRFDGNRQCGPGVPGGPLVADFVPGAAPYVYCSDPDGVVTTNQLGVQVCSYALPFAPVSSTSPVASQAVCSTDEDCARWSLAHGQDGDPLLDDQGNDYCLPGAALFDTEQPAQGDSGVVCRPVAKVVAPGTTTHPLQVPARDAGLRFT